MKREVEVFDNWIRRDNYLQSTENLQNRLQNIHKGPSDPNLPMGEIDWAFFCWQSTCVSFGPSRCYERTI